jgi:hypothetical protein
MGTSLQTEGTHKPPEMMSHTAGLSAGADFDPRIRAADVRVHWSAYMMLSTVIVVSRAFV